jgi:hypothetical protein
MRRPVAILLVLASACAALDAGAESVILPAARDNTLFEDAQGDTSNGAGPHLFAGRISQGRIRRALVAFDFAAAAWPADATLDSVTLELHLSSSSDPTPRTLTLHRVHADWGEAGSIAGGGSGAPAQAGDATWLHRFYPDVAWDTPGGAFDPLALASTVVAGTDGVVAWRDTALTGDVRAALADPAGHHGWIVLGDESVPGTARRFDTHEYPDPEFRPRLVLHGSTSVAARAVTLGAVKRRYR